MHHGACVEVCRSHGSNSDHQAWQKHPTLLASPSQMCGWVGVCMGVGGWVWVWVCLVCYSVSIAVLFCHFYCCLDNLFLGISVVFESPISV